MAFSAGNAPFSGRGRFRQGQPPISEMNVVPLVDVVLVLLIIFMLTAHVMEFGLEVEVPKVRQVKDSAEEFPVVTLTRSGEIYLGERPVNINLLGEEIKRRYPKTKAAYVRADKETVFDPLAQVISRLSQAQIGVNLVTQPEEAAGRRSR